MRFLVITTAILSLAGCAFNPMTVHYKDEGQLESDLVSLTTVDRGGLFSDIPRARLIKLIDENEVQVIGEKDFIDDRMWKTAYVKPGKYVLQVRCSLGEGYSLPAIAFEGKKGQHFVYQCEKIMEKNFLGIEGVAGMSVNLEEVFTAPVKEEKSK